MPKRRILYTDLPDNKFSINNPADRQALGFFVKLGLIALSLILVILAVVLYVVLPIIGV